MELGKKISLYVVKKTPIGLFLNEDPNELLNSLTLPREEVATLLEDQEINLGDQVEVYCYINQEKKLTATIVPPLVLNGEIGILECVESNHYGAFLHWGYDKDVLLPFNEQLMPVKKGYTVTVGIYTDKSDRLCATQKLRKFMLMDSGYQEGDTVTGLIYDINDEMGAFVAVDNKYFGLILSNEVMPNMKRGQVVECRVTKVREDGKLNLTMNKRIDLQMDEDSTKIYEILTENGGFLPYNDKTDSETVRRIFFMSKKAFKRSIGKLYKEKKIDLTELGIKLLSDEGSEE